jgi:hypothetical protein
MEDQTYVKCVTDIFCQDKEKKLAFEPNIGMMVVPVERVFGYGRILYVITDGKKRSPSERQSTACRRGVETGNDHDPCIGSG